MRLPHGKNPRRKTSKTSTNLGYDNLEDRNLLATVAAYDAGTQDLTISLSASNDVAVVDVATNGNVTVNGSQDLSAAAGTQTAAASALDSIIINGNAGTNQQVSLNGDFSNAAGRSVQSVSAQGVRFFTVNGDYQLSGNLNVTLDHSGGNAADGAGGRIRVGGTTTVNANNNAITFNNANNDFVGNVSVSTNVAGRHINISDANNIAFSNVAAAGDFNVTAGGNIVDAAGSTISAAGITRFNADNVVLGDNVGDTVNFNAVSSATTQDLILTEDSNTTLLNVSARNLNVTSSAGIFDGRRTDIVVSNQATFDAATAIRIGENGTDTFNADSVNFNAGGHVHIWEDSGTVITGVNTADSLSMFSEASIVDNATARLNVAGRSQFEGANIILGDSTTDQFNSGSIHFLTWGDLNISENSDTHIIETKNEARRMFLTSEGAITDDANARTNIQLFTQFTADSVNIGDSATDQFNAGSIGFATTGAFILSEDSATNIVAANTANSSSIISTGAITNIFTGAAGEGTNIDVTTNAAFQGASITLGQEANDSMNFGALQLNSPGVATVSEDSATHMTRSSQVQALNLTSAGGITDAIAASINVTGIANVEGTSVRWGETATDQVNAGSFTFNSSGAVNVVEDSSLNLVGSNTASSMGLAASGNVTDSLDTQTRVSGLLSVSGALVNLGSETTDVLEVGQLQFNSTGNTFITADSGFQITGRNDVGNRLTLVSNGDITDSATSQIRSQNIVSLTARDAIIGELATDCFDIINGGAASLFVTASGTSNVVLGGC